MACWSVPLPRQPFRRPWVAPERRSSRRLARRLVPRPGLSRGIRIMWAGSVVSIHLAPATGAPTYPVPEVKAVAGAGLEGDRHYRPVGEQEPQDELTLIQGEALDALASDHGIALNEPCKYLEDLTGRPGLIKGLVHRGGIRAQILTGGTIEVGAPVTPVAATAASADA